MPSTIPPPYRAVLSADDATITVDGTVAMRNLDLSTRGDRVLLVGTAGPLVTAIAGARPRADVSVAPPVAATVTRGSLAVLERDVARGAHRAVCGVALRDPPLPWAWTVRDYVHWAARLDGSKRKAARILVAGALSTLSLQALERTRLRALSTLERRVVVIAGAIVSQPAAVIIDDPFTGLDEREAQLLLGALHRACHGRAAVVALPRVQLTSPAGELAKVATDIILFREGKVVVHESALELFSRGHLYEVTVLDGADALRAMLAAEGLELRGGPHHFSLVLPAELGPSIVLRAAARARAPVSSVVPLVG